MLARASTARSAARSTSRASVGRKVAIETRAPIDGPAPLQGELVALRRRASPPCAATTASTRSRSRAIERAQAFLPFDARRQARRGEAVDLDLNRIIDQVVKDKGIKREVVIDTLEKAMLTAARRKFGAEREIEAQFNNETGEVELFEFKTVVDGEPATDAEIGLEDAHQHDPDAEVDDQIGIKIDTAEFGRIAAQTAKQVIIQEVRGAERQNVFDEYKDRKGEIVHGIVRRIEKGNLIVDLGRAEAILPRKEQVPREMFRVNERIRAYVLRRAARSRRARRSSCRAPAPSSWSSCSSRKCPRSTRASCASRPPRASPARARRSRSCRRTATSIRSARASACAAAACRPWCRSCAARRSTSCRGASDPVRYVVRGARAGAGRAHHGRRREALDGRDRARRPALARDRQEGPERAARGAAHALEDRHQERDATCARCRPSSRRALVGRAGALGDYEAKLLLDHGVASLRRARGGRARSCCSRFRASREGDASP